MHRPSEVYNRKLTGPQWMNPIREIGCKHFVLGTDYGIRAAPTPVQGMRTMIASLLDYEFTPDEIRTMTAINPARLIGLDPL
jgi:imidazolonepropionase-like amidohydrolase